MEELLHLRMEAIMPGQMNDNEQIELRLVQHQLEDLWKQEELYWK